MRSQLSEPVFFILTTELLVSTYQIAALSDSLRVLADMKEPVGDVLKRTEVIIL